MTDPKKDEAIIELTEVVEEAPSATAGSWMETTPPPLPPKKMGEPPKAAKNHVNPEDFKAIPESPLKKFLLAEEEPSPAPPVPSIEEKPKGISPSGSQPWRPVTPPPRPSPEPPRIPTQAPRMAPEPPPRKPPEPPTPAAPPRPPLPDVEAEMRNLREAMLARVEKWAAQEGERVLERVAREIFPRVAKEMIQKEIEKLKAEAEEKE